MTFIRRMWQRIVRGVERERAMLYETDELDELKKVLFAFTPLRQLGYDINDATGEYTLHIWNYELGRGGTQDAALRDAVATIQGMSETERKTAVDVIVGRQAEAQAEFDASGQYGGSHGEP